MKHEFEEEKSGRTTGSHLHFLKSIILHVCTMTTTQTTSLPVSRRAFQTSVGSGDTDTVAKFTGVKATMVDVAGSAARIGRVWGTVIIGYARSLFLRQQLYPYATLHFAMSEDRWLFVHWSPSFSSSPYEALRWGGSPTHPCCLDSC